MMICWKCGYFLFQCTVCVLDIIIIIELENMNDYKAPGDNE